MSRMAMHHLVSLRAAWPSPCGHMARTIVTWPGPPSDLVGQDVLLDGVPRYVIEAVAITDSGVNAVGVTVL